MLRLSDDTFYSENVNLDTFTDFIENIEIEFDIKIQMAMYNGDTNSVKFYIEKNLTENEEKLYKEFFSKHKWLFVSIIQEFSEEDQLNITKITLCTVDELKESFKEFKKTL